MKLLVVDRTLESQARIAKRIESLDAVEREVMNLSVKLSAPDGFTQKLEDVAVLVIGSDIGNEAAQRIAHAAKVASPNLEILMFVSSAAYSSGVFRSATGARIRKVLPDSASNLDFLQELVSIHEEMRVSGKVRRGKLFVVVQAKGGVGATSLCAALGEVCGKQKSSTLLWDLDVESRDLTCSLNYAGFDNRALTSLIDGSRELSKKSFEEAILPLTDSVSILTPPTSLAACNDLVGHPDGVVLIHDLSGMARSMFDNIIVDTAGRMGPATGSLIALADQVLVVIDDSLLGMSAVNNAMRHIAPLVKNKHAIKFICSGTRMAPREMKNLIRMSADFEDAWLLPAIPVDKHGHHWAGSGKTLYSAGGKRTRKTFEEIAREIGLSMEERSNLKLLSFFRAQKEAVSIADIAKENEPAVETKDAVLIKRKVSNL